MSESKLTVHCGARIVERSELDRIEPPPGTDTWRPIKHALVLDTVGSAMQQAGFRVRSVKSALSRGNHRLFATLDTETGLAGGDVTLAVAVVNSTDKSLPMKFVAGSRVFICDNLALRSDLMAPVRRKHSKNGFESFVAALTHAVTCLDQFKEIERARIKRFQQTDISDTQAESVLLRAYERDILSNRLLPIAINEWRKPSYEDFAPRTLWSLENAFTTVLSDTVVRSNPQRFCSLSLSLQELLTEVAPLGQALPHAKMPA
jgi:hypothetical protein